MAPYHMNTLQEYQRAEPVVVYSHCIVGGAQNVYPTLVLFHSHNCVLVSGKI